MRIFLLRHAEAQPKTEVARDEDRALTPKGETRLRKAARGLRRLDLFPDRILIASVTSMDAIAVAVDDRTPISDAFG